MNDCGCAEAFRRLDDFIDRELDAAEMEMVAKHLEKCHACAVEFKFEGSLLKCLKDKLDHIDLPPDLIKKIKMALDNS